MFWIYLLCAGFFEICFTTFLKLSNDFTHIPYTILFAICAISSFLLLNKSLQGIPIGTAYAVWTGIGASGTVIMGILFFKESSDFLRLLFLFTLVASIVGLKFVSSSE